MQTFYFLFAAVTIGAGVQGALAGSRVSLIAAGILGAFLLAGGFLLPTRETLALSLALTGSLGVAGKFVPAFWKKGRALWPAGILGLLGLTGIGLSVAGFFRP